MGWGFIYLKRGSTSTAPFTHNEYKNGKHDDGSDMLYRMVGKREFGETCRPDSFFNNPNARDEKGRYVMSLVFHDGLSFGKPNDANWKPIIPPVKEVTE